MEFVVLLYQCYQVITGVNVNALWGFQEYTRVDYNEYK